MKDTGRAIKWNEGEDLYMKNRLFMEAFFSVLLVMMIILVSGCGKVNQENYAKIEVGMEYAEVVDILGEPSSCEAIMAAKTCTWGKDPKTISIQFVGDKVVLRSAKGL